MESLADEPEKCAKCGQYPEDILMLSCNHDLCLNCAAVVFGSGWNSAAREQQEIKCPICSEMTQLDESSINELQKLLITNFQNSSTQKLQQAFQNNSEFKQNNYPLSASQSINQEQQFPILYSSKQKFEKEYCQEHDVEILYYCFDCNCHCICSECIIHGFYYNQKQHNVSIIKKSYPIILQKVETRLDQANQTLEEISKISDLFALKQTEIQNYVQFSKQQLHDAFNVMRVSLDKKEQELNNFIDEIEANGVYDIKTKYQTIQKQQAILQKQISEIQEKINQNKQINLLNYYADTQKLTDQNFFENNEIFNKLNKDFTELQNQKIIDLHLILDQINQINSNLMDIVLPQIEPLEQISSYEKGIQKMAPESERTITLNSNQSQRFSKKSNYLTYYKRFQQSLVTH